MKILIKNDYNYMESCILCYPCNLRTVNTDDEHRQVDKNIASSQYNIMLNKLMDHGAKVHFMDLNGGPSQVFTRDIGFAVEDILFISNMTDPIRQAEIEGLKELAQKYGLKAHIMEQKAEGGDIIVDNKLVFVGQGIRTNKEAAQEIEYVLKKNSKDHQVITVAFDESKIHLDCVFNILDEETCIISSGVFEPEKVSKHFSKHIWVPDEDMKDLASNIVQLGKNDYLCSSENFTGILNSNGFNTHYIDFSEIIKCNGSLGCCVLPLSRP